MQDLDTQEPDVDSDPPVALALRRIENGAMALVSVALFSIMLVTVLDVVRRYLFNAPLTWAYDVTAQYLMVAAFFLALSYTLRVEGHMRVDLVLNAVRSPTVRAWLLGVGDALALLLFLATFGVSLGSAWAAWIDVEVLPGEIPLPVWLARVFVPLGTLILVLRLAYRLSVQVIGRRW